MRTIGYSSLSERADGTVRRSVKYALMGLASELNAGHVPAEPVTRFTFDELSLIFSSLLSYRVAMPGLRDALKDIMSKVAKELAK